ncbi:hypothetical protein GCM10010517_78450 [Streptosporangium fragile]|uniref:DUF4232 domain-containing protein n=2 Tax=Streptosporangium fragile TaxID=46186 RepID=A0ABN3WER8_9ACTN
MSDMTFPRVRAAVLVILALAGCGDEHAAAPGGKPTPSAGLSGRPTPGTASPERPASTTASCPASGVVLWTREPSAAMGLRSMSVELYNCGDRNRVLKGYPGIGLLDADLHPVKAAVGHGSSSVAQVDSYDRPPATVTLRPGEVASAGILWRNLVTDHPERAVTAQVLDITPMPGAPAERLWDVGIDLGTTRKVAVGPWEKVREANGVEIGDNAPHYGDNHAWRRRLELSPADRMVGEPAAGRIRPALERLRVKGGFTAESVRAELLSPGFPAADAFAHATGATDEVAYEVYPGRGACVHGELQPKRLTVAVDGVRLEGGCAPPA